MAANDWLTRLNLAQLGFSAVIATGLLGCSDEASSDVVDEFELELDDFEGGLLLSVAEVRDEVWAVGGRPGATAVVRGANGELGPIDNPGQAMAWWVCDVDDGVVVVGDEGLILLYDGDFEIVDLGVQSTLYGCAGESLDDFWVVGGDPQTGPPEMIRVRDGQGEAPDLGNLLSQLPNVLFKVEAIDDRLFVVGDKGVVLARDGEDAWSLEVITDEPLFTVSGTDNQNVWAVGGRSAGTVFFFDGIDWSEESPVGAPGLFGVSARGDRVLAAGHQGAIYERVGGDWVAQLSPTSEVLHAIWSGDDGQAWAAGGNILEQSVAAQRGLVLAR